MDPKNKYNDNFCTIGEEMKIEPWFLKAIALQESSFNWTARRFEPRFYKRYIKDKPTFLSHRYYDHPEVIASSFGLMQLMYTTAELVGLPRESNWSELCYPPEFNILLGARYLTRKLDYYGNISSAIAAYNAGTARIREGSGEYENQWYVDKVMKYADRFKSDFT